MKVDFTYETVFSFGGPNFCLLGNEFDFRNLAEAILDLTDNSKPRSIRLMDLHFNQNIGEEKQIIFSSNKEAKKLGTFNSNGELLFELDPNYWERLFKFFVIMSWSKKTYYLNADENHLADLDLMQECNFICSSEF